ncbi:MAG: MotA/TolQ/ExbB proton channel family protein [Eubacteriales bacterium]|nr:MotA/TolQ/ExbB proton channel family protein [Eubacteriales bacterium]MDD3882437.1 MotA/TolQ/ExbB proton channel family protein [Eubacteriales bacterium]MDD4513159.1 MotA/TolQ/ExbB proton channel family protein [Eubacteriales bacterium]
MFQDILDFIINKLPEFLIYSLTVIVAITGFIKCIFPLSRASRRLMKASHAIETAAMKQGDSAIWQDPLFLGKSMQSSWSAFLRSAQSIGRQGSTLDVSGYINEVTVIDAVGRGALADVVPGFLTSLGILGTFWGLMTGLSSLDTSDTSAILTAIPTLISGMKFAFGTSVVGISCSLLFNFIYRMQVGRVQNALSDFHDVFHAIAMPDPNEIDVIAINERAQNNDYFREWSEQFSMHLPGIMENAVGTAVQPLSYSLDHFVMATTREQLAGVDRIVTKFVESMNLSMDGQFRRLAKTMSDISTSQSYGFSTLNDAIKAAQALAGNVSGIQQTNAAITQRLEGFLSLIESSRAQDEDFKAKMAALLSSLHESSAQQARCLGSMQDYQAALQSTLKEYTAFSDKLLSGVRGEADKTKEIVEAATAKLDESSRKLAGSYNGFVESVTEGLSRSLGMFDESVHGAMSALSEQLKKSDMGGDAKLLSAMNKTTSEIKEILSAQKER